MNYIQMPDPPEQAPTGYALWVFAKHVANFFHQAQQEGQLDEYFNLVNRLYEARWPQATNADTLSLVFFF